jgi:iron-sulfur cluster assembly protein CyaY
MNDSDFDRLADAALERISQALEETGVDCDWELKGGGVLELEFPDGSRMIINRHSAAQQIWVAARSGGYHFGHDGSRWIDTRDRTELFASLSRRVSEQSGTPVILRGD